jgi:hypothetical protein
MKPGCLREHGEGPSWEQVGAVAWPIFVPQERRQALGCTPEETVVHSVRLLDPGASFCFAVSRIDLRFGMCDTSYR